MGLVLATRTDLIKGYELKIEYLPELSSDRWCCILITVPYKYGYRAKEKQSRAFTLGWNGSRLARGNVAMSFVRSHRPVYDWVLEVLLKDDAGILDNEKLKEANRLHEEHFKTGD